MITEKINAKELFSLYDETTNELMQLITSFKENQINTIPFEGSWTAAQVAEHITKSNVSIIHALNLEGKPVERNPEERVQELKETFLNFNTKFQSPEFILPTKDIYQRDKVIEDLKGSVVQLKAAFHNKDLSQIINVPAFGKITKLEIFHFVLYHTQRHIHQVKNIFEKQKHK